MKTFKLHIVSPERSEVFQNIYSVSAESVNGDFSALADHEPFIMKLNPCIISVVDIDNIAKKFFVNHALMKIMPMLYSIMAEEFYDIEKVNKDFLDSYYDKNAALKIKRELNL